MKNIITLVLASMLALAFVPTMNAEPLPCEDLPVDCSPVNDVINSLLGEEGSFEETLASSGTYNDGWAFSGAEGDEVHYLVDNTDQATDLRARICSTDEGTGCFMFGDDEADCTNPPGSFGCPEETGTLPADDDGVYYLFVGAWSFSSDGFPAGYAGSLTVNGAGVALTLEVDDDP